MSSTFRPNRLILIAVALASSSRAAEPRPPSLLDDMPRIIQVLSCLDRAPLNDKPASLACAEKYHLSLKANTGDPRSLDDYRLLVASFWVVYNRGPDRQQNTAMFSQAVDYARCVEGAAYKDPDFSSRILSRVQTSRENAQLACKDHPLSMHRLDPLGASLPPNAVMIGFAKALSNLTFNYALEANGWFPDKMRPCLRYADGRPPSAGCAHEQLRVEPRAQASPAQPQARKPELPSSN